MTIKEYLSKDITKTIRPVIYFHEKNPEDLAREVDEYVITSKNDRDQTGIHEQYVNLLRSISKSFDESETLPASWISGFFGSGKSSFAKLFGLSLGGLKLPSGKPLSEALLDKDDTPNANDFRKAWEDCNAKFGKTISVVFDISAEAKTGESPSSVIYRQVQKELGYSDKEPIARYELLLQMENRFQEFVEAYQSHYKSSWLEDKYKTRAGDSFSYIYHRLYPTEFTTPTAWYKSHYSNLTLREDDAIRKAVKDIQDMISFQYPGHRLLIVIDEMSQFIGANTDRMLNLQTFVSEIGTKANSPIWLFVTGQEKLEDNIPGMEHSKLQDRFPPKFRVHLHKTNVNEIVRRRILKKADSKINDLKSFFQTDAISKIKLHSYNSDSVTQEELISFYPLLPSYVPLLLEISQAIKTYSTKAQADSSSVRSVLQTVYDLFNSPRTNFKDKQLGQFVNMRDIYDIIGSSLGTEVAVTIDTATNKLSENHLALDIIRIIAVLELNAEKEPVTMDLIRSMLFSNIDSILQKENISKNIELLEKNNFVTFDEKLGYRIKDYIAQEWGKERTKIPVSEDEVYDLIKDMSNDLFESITKPKLEDIPIEVEISHNKKAIKNKPLPKVKLDLNFREDGLYKATRDYYILDSKKDHQNNYGSKEKFILLVPGNTDSVDGLARHIIQTQKMLNNNQGTLSDAKQKVSFEEKRRLESDKDKLRKELITSWGAGKFYFNGREESIPHSNSESSFFNHVKDKLEEYLKEVFSRIKDSLVSVTMKDIEKLFDKEIISPANSLLDSDDGLNILTRRAGKFEPLTDKGIPQRILDFIKDKNLVKGEQLIGYFGSQPFGYSQNNVIAVVVGLLRAETIKIKHSNAKIATSFKDEGIKDALTNLTQFKQVEISPVQEVVLEPRDKKNCRDFFENDLGYSGVEIDTNSIHEAIFNYFPDLVEKIQELSDKFSELGLRIPEEIRDFHRNLDLCRKDKTVAGSVTMLKNCLADLKVGVRFFNDTIQHFTPDSQERIKKFTTLLSHEIPQIIEIDEDFSIQEDIKKIKQRMESDSPWKDLADLNDSHSRIKDTYKEIRFRIISENRKEVESAFYSIQKRKGFEILTEEEIDSIQSKLNGTVRNLDVDSLYPNLIQIKNLSMQISVDKNSANDLMDEILHKKNSQNTIRKISHSLNNQDITSIEELDSILQELRQKIAIELENGYRVRLV